MQVVRGTRESFLFWIAACIVVFNLLDGMLTLTAVQAGAATEANPLMDMTLAWGGIWFILVKVALVSLGVTLLWGRRGFRIASISLIALCLFYGGVVAYQLSALGVVAAHLV
jgi:hypothetical protein